MPWVTRDDSGVWNLHGAKPAVRGTHCPGCWPVAANDTFVGAAAGRSIFRGLKLKPGEGPCKVKIIFDEPKKRSVKK